MRIIVISDLHITADSNYDSIPWVNNFCNFIKGGKYYAETLILVLGDIINNDGKNGELAFEAADKIFTYIENELLDVNYRIVFIPGNHDYCNKNLDAFNRFCRSHQTTSSEPFDFSCKKTFHISVDDINLIFTDSIQNKDYKKPGQLDYASISSCIRSDKENILFMHHSLLFEDLSDHTGVIQQPEAVNFLKKYGIEFVFHGHTHAMRSLGANGECKLFGVGSIGKENPGIDNEKEQFIEVQISGKHVESVANWLWRGGMKEYRKDCIYPITQYNYDSGESIPRIKYEKPEGYIKRYVLPRNIASENGVTRLFALDKKVTLFDVCKKERLVLLIADAGLGKTVEMRNLAHVITSDSRYLRPVFLPLNVYEGESIEEYLNIQAKDYHVLDPARFILIMDGYDELSNPDVFRKALSKYINANPETYICISMRSNFGSVNFSAFKDFSVYQLLELGVGDIELELKKHKINEQDFYGECTLKGLQSLLSNPFYLEKIIEIHLSGRVLPNQTDIITSFVDIQFSRDAEKFEYTNLIEDKRYRFERALIRFAYAMQLLGCSSCDEKTYGSILDDADRQLIKHSSLTIVNSTGHSFCHNMFREYFVAKYVCNMDLVDIIKHITIPETEYLDPNWFNVLGFILHSKQCNELESWVFKVEPLVLTKLEADRVKPELRYSILVDTLNNIVNKNTRFRSEICSEQQLATFVQSPEAIDLLLKHIEVPTHFRSLYFCLSLLLNFVDLYGRENEVRRVLKNCYQSNSVQSWGKAIAVKAIAVLRLNTPEITEDLIQRFAESQSSYERLGVYYYLLQLNLCDDNIDFLLNGIKYISQYNKDSNATEYLTLIKCLNNISTPEAIEKSIKWYSCKEHIDMDFYNRKELMSSLFDKAANIYCNENHSLFEAVYVFFVNVTRQYSRYLIPLALKFFSNTNTIKEAFILLVAEDVRNHSFVIEDMIQAQPELIDVLCQLYLEDKLCDSDLFKDYALYFQSDSTIFEKCAEAIRIKTGEVVKKTKKQFDYDLQRQRDIQVFFDSLFNRQDMRALLVKLAEFYGDREINYEQTRKSKVLRKHYPEGTLMARTALIQWGFKKERIIDFVDWVDWDSFFIDRICYLFKNESASKFLFISEDQLNTLKKLYLQLENTIDYNTAIKEKDANSYNCALKLQYYMTIKEALNIPSPDEYYLGLLAIPYMFVNGLSNVEDKYTLIEQHIARHIITQQIEKLTPNETRVWVLNDLMFGCRRYRIRSCKDVAIHMCKRNELSPYNRINALEYLLEEFGFDLILDEIMPAVDIRLFEIIADMLLKTEDNRLKEEIIKRYDMEPSEFLLKKLIVLNVKKGLEIYIEESRKVNGIPDLSIEISEVTGAISEINDISLLPLLLEAVRVRFSDSFKDGSFHTLYSSLQSALSNCAKRDYSLVQKSIDDLKVELSHNSEAISFCNTLQANILEANKMSLIKKWSIQEVREILRRID